MQAHALSFIVLGVEAPSVAPQVVNFKIQIRREFCSARIDGEGSDAGVGIAAWCDSRLGPVPLAGFIEVPDEIRALWSYQRASFHTDPEYHDITEIEAIGPVLILHNWPWLVKDALWIHFIDNNGALGAL